jgi:hypothetical protein
MRGAPQQTNKDVFGRKLAPVSFAYKSKGRPTCWLTVELIHSPGMAIPYVIFLINGPAEPNAGLAIQADAG